MRSVDLRIYCLDLLRSLDLRASKELQIEFHPLRRATSTSGPSHVYPEFVGLQALMLKSSNLKTIC